MFNTRLVNRPWRKIHSLSLRDTKASTTCPAVHATKAQVWMAAIGKPSTLPRGLVS